MTTWSQAEAKRTPEEKKQHTQVDKEFEKLSDTDLENVAGGSTPPGGNPGNPPPKPPPVKTS